MSELKSGDQSLLDKAAPIADHLATLNPKQRKAAEYGIKPGKTKRHRSAAGHCWRRFWQD